MTPLRQENCCMVTKWEHWGSLRAAVCVFPILSSIYSRPFFPWRIHLTLMQLSCPAHHFEKVYLRLRKKQWQTWGEENSLNRTRGDVLPLYHQGGDWTFVGRGWCLRQQKVPLPACKPCCGCLEVSGRGSASPGMCVKGTRRLSQEDGLEQTCTGVGMCRSAFWDTPRPGFLTYQDTPFFILFPHTTTLFIFL